MRRVNLQRHPALGRQTSVATQRAETTERVPVSGYAVVDLETTGIHPGRHERIVEVAVVHVSPRGVITGTWETLVNPRRDLGRSAFTASVLPRSCTLRRSTRSPASWLRCCGGEW